MLASQTSIFERTIMVSRGILFDRARHCTFRISRPVTYKISLLCTSKITKVDACESFSFVLHIHVRFSVKDFACVRKTIAIIGKKLKNVDIWL